MARAPHPLRRFQAIWAPLFSVVSAGACATPIESDSDADPSQGEVALPAAAGWNARLVHENGGVGVWTVGSFDVFPQYASPEVIGLDDRGRCLVVVSYSGKWTTLERVHDGKWLGGLAQGDVDDRVAGNEVYTGGQGGNLYQLVAHAHGALDARLIAHFPGKEIHTLVAGELDGDSGRAELLAFTRPGALYRLTADGPDGAFQVAELALLDGRVRDALVLPGADGDLREIATVSRAGRLEILRLTPAAPIWALVHAEPMGMGRLALRPARAGGATVLYSTLDDGRILRHERRGSTWSTETIYHGPQGPRGLAAGRFHEDPGLESVAIFGYSGEVELLTRRASGWESETVFVDRDRGHWLEVAELDGRNGTDELLASGYGGRIVMLVRPPGFARSERTAE